MRIVQTQAIRLEELLNEEGWRVVSRYSNLDWWADEQWYVESIWSPLGFSVYITFLVDPMHDGPRKKQEAVYAASVNLKPPSERSEAVKLIILREHELLDLVMSASDLRDAAI